MSAMGGGFPPEPRKPLPEDFGLSARQVTEYQQREAGIAIWPLWLFLIVIPALFVYSVLGLPSPSEDVVRIVGVVIVGLVLLAQARKWARQAGSGPLREYRAALASYEAALRQRQATLRQQEEERQRTQEAWWRGLSGRKFEIEVKRLLEKSGYGVQHTGAAGDGGVDLVLTGGKGRIIVQCKQHAQPVSPATVRDLYGALHASRASGAWLVSASGFTSGAKDFAQGKPILLLDLKSLLGGQFPKP